MSDIPVWAWPFIVAGVLSYLLFAIRDEARHDGGDGDGI